MADPRGPAPVDGMVAGLCASVEYWHGLCMLIGCGGRYRAATLAEDDMQHVAESNIGDLVSLFYDEFFEMYGDAELAAVAAAAVINDMLTSRPEAQGQLIEAA